MLLRAHEGLEQPYPDAEKGLLLSEPLLSARAGVELEARPGAGPRSGPARTTRPRRNQVAVKQGVVASGLGPSSASEGNNLSTGISGF